MADKLEQDVGRVPTAPGSHASHSAPSGLRPAGFDPSRIAELRALLAAASAPPWDHGCLADGDPDNGCQCAYIFDGGYAGGIGQVFFPRDTPEGLRIHEYTPEKSKAAANLRLIVAAVNALPDLLNALAQGADQ